MAGRRIELVRRGRSESHGLYGDAEFRHAQLIRELDHLRKEISHLEETCRFKDLMLEDEAKFLEGVLEGGESVTIDALRRRISRLKGALNHGR